MKLSVVDRAAPGWRPDARVVADQEAVAAALGDSGWTAVLAWVDDDEIRRLNRDYRGKDAATDVLSFSDLDEEGEGTPDLAAGTGGARRDLWRAPSPEDGDAVGEIVMAPAFIAARCAERGWDLDDEIVMLTSHGLLHVLGWDHEDEDEAERMRALETGLLRDRGRGHPLLAGEGGKA